MVGVGDDGEPVHAYDVLAAAMPPHLTVAAAPLLLSVPSSSA